VPHDRRACAAHQLFSSYFLLITSHSLLLTHYSSLITPHYSNLPASDFKSAICSRVQYIIAIVYQKAARLEELSSFRIGAAGGLAAASPINIGAILRTLEAVGGYFPADARAGSVRSIWLWRRGYCCML